MLLKVGVTMMVVSLVLAAGVAAAVVLLREENTQTSPVPAGSRAASEKSVQEKEFDPGQKLEIDDEPAAEGSAPKEAPPEERASKSPASRPESESPLAPVPVLDWPEPTAEEVATANAPRYYQPTPESDMTLTVVALGLYDVPIISSPSYEVLDRGLMHEPETSLPWDDGAGRNVFLAGHYLGWPGTASHLVFYNLDKLRPGDEVILEDGWGRDYRYKVSESFGATPYDSWVMGQEVGRDMLTLQTCIPPLFEERLIVRADRV
jgi:sortase A